MKKLRLVQNWKLTSADVSHPVGKSMTVPGEAYSIQELYKRFAAGLPASNVYTAMGHDDPSQDNLDEDDLSKLNDLDLHERELKAQEYGQRAQKAREWNEKLEREKKAQREKEELDKKEMLDIREEHRKRKRQGAGDAREQQPGEA